MEGCMKEYTSKFNLKKHVSIVHLKKHNFSCQKCGKIFVSKQNLREHSFIHSGIKPLKCSFCGKKFRQTSQLCMHKRKHKKTYKETLNYVMQLDQEESLK
jgi:growth factor independent 1